MAEDKYLFCSQPYLESVLSLAPHHGELIGVDDECFAVVLGHDIEDDAGDEQ